MNMFRLTLNSSSLLLIGLILLYGSQSFHFIFGNIGRYALLVVGFGCVLMAAYWRSESRWIQRNFQFIFLSGVYLTALLALSFVQEHDIFNARNMVFIGVCYAMFIAGYLLAKEPTRDGEWSNSIVTMICIGGCILALYSYLEHVKTLASPGDRGNLFRGASELHPVGVAYVNVILIIVCLYMRVTTKHLISKLLYTIAIAMAFLVIVTTGSRGAVLWGTLSFCTMVYILFANKLLKINIKMFFTAVLDFLLGGAIVVYLFRTNQALSGKLDMLIHRFEGLFHFAGGNTAADLSSQIRMNIYNDHSSNIDTWVVSGLKDYSANPHNQFLEIFVRFGLLGLPLFGFSLYVMGKSLLKAFSGKYELSPEWYLIMFVFLFSYMQSMTNLNLELNRTLWLGFGFLYGYQYHLKGFLRHK